MPLDFKKLRNKAKNLENMGSGVAFFKPKMGRNVIRVLPAKDGGDGFYKEVLRHNNLDQVGLSKPFMNCRKTDENEDECPLCDLSDFMSNEDDKKENKIGRGIKARSRFFLNVCYNSKDDRDNENWNTIMVYDCPPSVFQGIISNIADDDYIDENGESMILNPEDGFDFVIEKSGKGGRFNTNYTVKTRPRTTPVHIKNWKEKLNDLNSFAEIKSIKELEAFIDGEDEEENEDEEEEEEKPRIRSHVKKPLHHNRKHNNFEDDVDEDNEEFDDDEEDEEEEKPVTRRRYKHHRPVRKSDDEDDESDELEREINNEAKRVSRRSGSHKKPNHRRKFEEEDDEDFDDDEDDFDEDNE